MFSMDQIVLKARELNSSDIHISVGLPLKFRINGDLVDAEIPLTDDEKINCIMEIMSEDEIRTFESGLDVDFAYESSDGNRQRVNVYRYMKGAAATIRLLNNSIPTLESLGLPKVLESLADEPRGLILVTGPTGSGKSTTLAAMIDYINKKKSAHILTIEDPIEYVYKEGVATIHQREVGRDVVSFAAALRSALREDPDIILVGEMRDYETISAALTAAETGHLVLSTLHTTGAAQTIDRIIDACPPEAQNQIRTQLSGILKGVVTQCLMSNAMGNGRVVATEVLIGTDAVLNMIRENKCHQLSTTMQSGAFFGMHTLNGDIVRLLNAGKINKETALQYTNDKREFENYLI